ncbi:uncharacterized protein fusl [Anabrus simplex]|uniref:uncharacterized protein fusl n=1 Tax=Anabrus simplex TaxID=316456 RepID=UPI0035A286A9
MTVSRQKHRPSCMLYFADSVFSACVVAPLVVGYWRGLWHLQDHYRVSAWCAFVGGISIHCVLCLARSWLEVHAGYTMWHPLAVRVYSILYSTACISHWRGGWAIIDSYPHSFTLITALSGVCLLASRTVRNVIAPPCVILLDTPQQAYSFPTAFRKSSRDTWLYVLDCVFSVTVVGSLVVFVWRGSWTLLDIYIYPNHHDWSAWASLAIGYSIIILIFSIQKPMKILCARLKGIPRLIVADTYLLASFAGTCNLWRGIWNLLNVYFLHDLPLVSYWASHIVCLLLLMLLNCSNSVLVRGVYIDGEEEGGKCVVFPIYYLRLFFQTRRLQKLEKIHEEQQKQQQQQTKKRGASISSADAVPPPGTNHLVLAPLMDAPETVV